MREGVDEPVPWPVSEALLGIGLRDSFREIHPDPVENPGITHGNPDFHQGGGGDRIDYLYAGGPAVTQTSELVGEVGGPNVDREYEPLDLRPPRRAVDVRGDAGRAAPDAVPRTPAAHRGRGARRPLQRAGQRRTTRSRSFPRAGRPTRRSRRSPPTARRARRRSTPRRSTRPATTSSWWTPTATSSNATRFWVRSEDEDVALATDKTTYAVGEPIEVTLGRRPREPLGLDRGLRGRRGRPRRRTTTCSGATPAATTPVRCPRPSSARMTMGRTRRGSPGRCPPATTAIHYLLADQYDSAGYVEVTVE